jgi:DNA-binding transcriptional ArsR family regulator
MSDSTPAAEAAQCARYLKALGDPVRLQMMRALQSGPKSVSDLVLLLEVEMANVSHHLRVLYHAGLVTTQREGKFIYYSLCKEVLKSNPRLAGQLDFGCCKLDLRPEGTANR